jgi:hypothetical protein
MKKHLYEVFYIDDLTPEEQDNIYNLYKTSYEKSVGTAWDKSKFFDRAENWDFFGDQTGYVATRVQGSGLYKLAVVGGNVRGILKGIQELTSLNKPTWGMVSSDILPMMKKLGFKTPNALIMNGLLRFIPKEVFGGVDFKINSDGSITLNYEDTGSAKKYFIGNQQYFDWLKSQIKDKINPLKLTNLLKEVLLEAKQVGNLYHFTPINYCIDILKSQYIKPNYENQVSTTRYADSDIGFISHGETNVMCRIMLDGNKISNKFKIKGFVHSSDIDTSYGDDENLDYENKKDFLKRKGAKGKYAEEAIETKGERFYLLPYIKRIDVFIEKELNKKQQKYLETLKSLLDKINIPYKIYQGTPKSNTPFKQSKEGDSTQFTYDPVSEPKFFTIKPLEIPWKTDQIFSILPNPKTYPVKNDNQYIRIPYILNNTQVFSSPDIPDFYIINQPTNLKIYTNKSPEKNEKGADYSSSITQNLIKSLDVKNMKELGFENAIKKSYNSLNIPLYKEITRDSRGFGEMDDYQIKDINTFLDKKITLIPKDLIDTYFIKSPSSINNDLYKRKGISKK